ncbi:MAG: FAD-binding oxidoreductase [Saprospiraceae bacterium]|nr:FAD-binding oxidoreductase [Saprospiraceae bacterium]
MSTPQPKHRLPRPGWEQVIRQQLEGDLATDDLNRTLFATDASVYREIPLGVCYPRHDKDVGRLMRIAHEHMLTLIPRAAGTSLGGQCVGDGLVVDVSRHMHHVLSLDVKNKQVTVQPGVIRDDLNRFLEPHGLFFSPNTSTSNRCMIGGMVGNNSCGSTSIVYGSTRDHVHRVTGYLSDGSKVSFQPQSADELAEIAQQQTLAGKIYRHLLGKLGDPATQKSVRQWYPKPSIRRRNNGYAIDTMLEQKPFLADGAPFNLASMVCGSEGTLMLVTEITLDLDDLPPPIGAMVCVHYTDLLESMESVVPIMNLRPYSCELMDKAILDCTKGSRAQEKNRFFLEGDPAAVLMVEFRADSIKSAVELAESLIATLKVAGYGYAFPVVTGKDIQRVMSLRQAGLGVLSNLPGRKRAVACIEDTAVDIADLKDYIRDFSELMASFHQQSIYYAHAGDGEIHLRPILDLKTNGDVQLFRAISAGSAKLVKKYQGSLSGEHGIGRVRAEFLPGMIGPDNYALLQEIKDTWDPDHLLNPGKIVLAPPMDQSLRYAIDQAEPKIDTVFDFPDYNGMLGAAERCNGSGDCRKSMQAGGTMCPSYQATRNEMHTTRARANALREYMTRSAGEAHPLDHPELAEVLDLCLSCKGCTGECPSNVDMAALKSEFQHHYYQAHPRPRGHYFILHNDRLARMAGQFAGIANWATENAVLGRILRWVMDIAPKRSIPPVSGQTWWSWFQSHLFTNGSHRTVYFLIDEFTNYFEAEIGIQAMQLTAQLGYEVKALPPLSSGRAAISKGYLDVAKSLARQQVERYQPLLNDQVLLVGLEPSALLSFRDEYPRLLRGKEQLAAKSIASRALLFEEFIVQSWHAGEISPEQFDREVRHLVVHGHCHQKALVGIEPTVEALSIAKGNHIELIPSGCCGMAGSFGYEPEHYPVSMAVGEMVLFPSVRKVSGAQIIVASGTSCRHQIRDGTGRKALHPVEVLASAFKHQ